MHMAIIFKMYNFCQRLHKFTGEVQTILRGMVVRWCMYLVMGVKESGLMPQPKPQQAVHVPSASGDSPEQRPDRAVGCAGAHKKQER
jgi:hypothetical protein